MVAAGDAGAVARRVRDKGVVQTAMVRQAEAEEEVIRAGVAAAYGVGGGAPRVEVVVFGGEGVIERPRLASSERTDALMAALDEREEGVRERVARIGEDAVEAGVRRDPWDVPVIEPPEFVVAWSEPPIGSSADSLGGRNVVGRLSTPVQFWPWVLPRASLFLSEPPIRIGPGPKGGGTRMSPLPEAEGAPHTVTKNNPDTNRVWKYEEFRPQTNPRDPKRMESLKRYDGNPDSGGHFNKVTRERVELPHIHEPITPGGIRPALPHEIPK